jgi:hypothetical protein
VNGYQRDGQQAVRAAAVLEQHTENLPAGTISRFHSGVQILLFKESNAKIGYYQAISGWPSVDLPRTSLGACGCAVSGSPNTLRRRHGLTK